MLLGKRPRPPMRRTTSMRALSVEELGMVQESDEAATALGGSSKRPTEHQRSVAINNKSGGGGALVFMNHVGGGSNGNGSGTFVLSPRGSNNRSSHPRRNSADFLLMDATHFLRSCTLCKRHIAPGRDIYMYRGDTAYCSIECRQQQLNLDDKKEKCSMTSIKKEALPVAAEASANGETAAAA